MMDNNESDPYSLALAAAAKTVASNEGKDFMSLGLDKIIDPVPRRLKLTKSEHIKPLPVEWLIDDYVEKGSTVIIFGESQAFKTFLVMSMALSLATGRHWAGKAVRRNAVAYICGEGERGIGKRIAGWQLKHGVDPSEPDLYVSNMPVSLVDTVSQRELVDALIEDIVEGAFGVLVLDTIARNFGGDVNLAKDVNALFAYIDQSIRTKLPNITIILVGHPGLKDTGRVVGSYQWIGNSDAQSRVERLDGQLKTQYVPVKMKDADVPEGIVFDAEVFEFDSELGEPMSTLVLNHTDEGVSKVAAPAAKPKKLTGHPKTLYALSTKEWKPRMVLRDDFTDVVKKMEEADPDKEKISDDTSIHRAFTRALTSLIESGHACDIQDKNGKSLKVRRAGLIEQALGKTDISCDTDMS